MKLLKISSISLFLAIAFSGCTQKAQVENKPMLIKNHEHSKIIAVEKR